MIENKLYWRKLLWIPNIIGYTRCALSVATAVLTDDSASMVFFLTIVSFSLDGVDGYLARKFHQTSAFGAWLDVLVDLISRGIIWCKVNPMIGYGIMCWEWLVFVSTHSEHGKEWKNVQKSPAIVSNVMANNFKTIQGFYVVGSIFWLPLWCYKLQHSLLFTPPYKIQLLVLGLLIIGRTLAAIVEAWFIKQHVQSLLMTGDNPRQKRTS